MYPNVKKFGNPFIVLGSRLSRPTEAKVWSPDWQVGDTVFVLGVLTTNHVRDNANLESEYSVPPGDRNCEIETAVWIYVGNRSLLP
jgi:hypothetical protein